MCLILSNEEIDQILSIDDVIECLDLCYKDLANGLAGSRTRSDQLSFTKQPNVIHSLKSMDGVVPRFAVGAVRIDSDIIKWVENDKGNYRRVKIPSAPGKRYVGNVFLFSTETGELLSIFPDGVMQRMRVGSTNGLGAKYLSREDSQVYGLIGSGWQAGGQLMAITSVRPSIKKVKVYSTKKENREAFAKEWSEKLKLNITPVDSAADAMKGSDIVGCATNYLGVITDSKYISDGTFVTSVKFGEIDEATLRRASVVTIHTKDIRANTLYIGGRDAFPKGTKQGATARTDIDLTTFPEMRYVMNGQLPGRTKPEEITVFVNNLGLGFQFAAVGAVIYEKARQKGVGRMLPNEWFSETVHP